MPHSTKAAASGVLGALFFITAWALVPEPAHPQFTAVPDVATYEAILAAHPYSRRPPTTPEELRQIPKRDRPDLAAEQYFLLTMDPATGQVPIERLYQANLLTDQLKAEAFARGGAPLITTAWEERGPSRVGGRTRALLFDPNDPEGRRVFAAGVAGGLWVTEDITVNAGWTPVNDFWENLAVTALAYDPSNTTVMYAGTGEGFFNADAVRGAGIFKSEDGGATWTHLSSTLSSVFHYVQRIAVHPTTGDVYAATRQGIRRSQDGGETWESVQSGNAGDLEIAADGTIYATTGLGGAGRVYSSTTGNSGEWTQLNTGSNGFPTSGVQRIEIATAPSDASVLYAVTENSSNGGVGGMYRTEDGGQTWTSLTLPNDVQYGTDFSRTQAWYDLSLAVDPNDPNTAFVGGINLFRTTDGGASWNQLTHWYGGFGLPYVHADQHAVVYKPGSSTIALFSHDGGVNYTDNATAPQPIFWDRNTGYNVTQFYAGAIAPEAGSNVMLAGAQDNGTHRFSLPGINNGHEVRGGDGAFTFIDQDESNYAISSYVYNTYNLSTDGGLSFPITLINNTSTGAFINRADYDDREDIFYSYRNATSFFRILDVTGSRTLSTVTTPSMGAMTNLKVSPFAPPGTSTLFVGSSAGRIYRVDNAESSADVTELTQPGPGAISSIEFGDSEDQILVTISNYGVASVWESLDGGMTWANKEGNLPDMPIRWALYHPTNRNLVLLATEAGVWETTSFDADEPVWTPAPGFPTVSTHMLQYRESDDTVMAITHGRGVFTAVFTPSTVASEPGPSTDLPGTHALSNAYPNPFNPQTRFTLRVAEAQDVRVALYDVRGRQVAVLHDGPLAAGAAHPFEVDGRALPSGTYVVAVEGERFRDRLQVSLVK